jgi:hypothetical protein
VSHTVVAELLHGLGYSLQGNVKVKEGRQYPDRDAQFRYIARQVGAVQRRRQPAISVDTKKKELVGPFKNGGRAWRPAKTPQRVRVHDFVIPGGDGGKAIPYGVYDLHRDDEWSRSDERGNHRCEGGRVESRRGATCAVRNQPVFANSARRNRRSMRRRARGA